MLPPILGLDCKVRGSIVGVVMKSVDDMFFEIGLDRPTSLDKVVFAIGTKNLVNSLRKKGVRFAFNGSK